MFSLAGLLCAAPDALDDSYAKLKAAVDKKDADGVKANAADVIKGAKALETAPKPADAEEAKTWEERVKYGKEIETYTEYALASTAQQPGVEPAQAVALCETLLAQNPKSKYIDEVFANAYLVALGKAGGAAKQMAGMAKIVSGHPDNIVALTALVQGESQKSPTQALNYANKLIAATRQPKPEAIPEAEWEKTKKEALADGYYYAGILNGARQIWVDTDRNLKQALPLISGDQYKLGVAYFYLGLANYQLGKMTADRTKMQTGLDYTKKSVAIKGPMQDQAYRNQLGIQQDLNARH